jgi:hypothetical protein
MGDLPSAPPPVGSMQSEGLAEIVWENRVETEGLEQLVVSTLSFAHSDRLVVQVVDRTCLR